MLDAFELGDKDIRLLDPSIVEHDALGDVKVNRQLDEEIQRLAEKLGIKIDTYAPIGGKKTKQIGYERIKHKRIGGFLETGNNYDSDRRIGNERVRGLRSVLDVERLRGNDSLERQRQDRGGKGISQEGINEREKDGIQHDQIWQILQSSNRSLTRGLQQGGIVPYYANQGIWTRKVAPSYMQGKYASRPLREAWENIEEQGELSHEQIQAMSGYVGTLYGSINDALRQQKPEERNLEVVKNAQLMQSTAQTNRTIEPMELVRGSWKTTEQFEEYLKQSGLRKSSNAVKR